MKSVADGDVSLFLVLTATCSLFSMIGLVQLHGVVNRNPYGLGPQFSYAWAVPYWNTINFVFAMGWINIIAAIVFQSYMLVQRGKKIRQLTAEMEDRRSETNKEQNETALEQHAEASEREPLKDDEAEAQEAPIVIGVDTEEM